MKNLYYLLLLFFYSNSQAQINRPISISKIQDDVQPIQKLIRENKRMLAKKSLSNYDKLHSFLLNDSINSIKEYIWNDDSSAWYKTYTVYKIYDQNGYLKSYYGVELNGSKIFQVDIESDDNGNFILETKRSINQSGILENSEQFERKFNSNNQLISLITRYWDKLNARWVNSEKYVFDYSNLGHLTLDEHYTYDQGYWYISSGIRYNYQIVNGNFINCIIEIHDPQSLSYSLQTKYEYVYNASSHIISNEAFYYNAADMIWEIYSRNVFIYDNNNPSNNTPFRIENHNIKNDTVTLTGILDSVEWHDWNNANMYDANVLGKFIYYQYNTNTFTMEKSFKYLFQVLDQNNSELRKQHDWVNNAWLLSYQYELLYDDQKNMISNKVLSLQDSEYREDVIQYVNRYDQFNRLIEKIEQNNFNPNGIIVNRFKSEYDYNVSTGQNLNLHSSKDFIVYPNPSTDKIYLQFNSMLKEKQSIKIYTIHGALVQELFIEANTNLIELNIEQHGMYILSYNGHQERISIQP